MINDLIPPIVHVVDDDAAIRRFLRGLIGTVDLAVETFDSAQSFLDGYVELAGIDDVLFQMVVFFRLHYQTAGLAESGKIGIGAEAQIIGPVAPIVIAFPGKGGAIKSGIMHADDSAGTGGRTVTDFAVAIERQGFPAVLGHLKCDGCADDTGANDDGVG